MSCNSAFIQREGHFTVLSANTGLTASVGSHTARVVGQLTYGTFLGAGMLLLSSGLAATGAMRQQCRSIWNGGSVRGWWKLYDLQPMLWKPSVQHEIYSSCCRNSCHIARELTLSLMGCHIIFSCRGASGTEMQNRGQWLPCPVEVLTKMKCLSKNSS